MSQIANVCERIGDGYEITITLEERDAIAGLLTLVRELLVLIDELDQIRDPGDWGCMPIDDDVADATALIGRARVAVGLPASRWAAGTPAAPQDPDDSGNDVPGGARTPT